MGSGLAVPISIFFSVYIVLFLCSLFVPCIAIAVTGDISPSNCVSIQESFFINSDTLKGMSFISFVSGFYTVLISPLIWIVSVPIIINIILELLRLVAYVCLWYIVNPVK